MTEQQNKVARFKGKRDQFKTWLEEVYECNFMGDEVPQVESAILIWETKDKHGASKNNHARFNCSLDTFCWFTRCMNDAKQEWEFEDFLYRRIGDFIEYI